MKRVLFALFLPAMVFTLAAKADDKPPAVEVPKDKRVVAYFTEWGVYGRKYHVADIPATKVTHINYAFAKVTEQGTCEPYDTYAAVEKAYPGDKPDGPGVRGNFNQLQLLKKKHPHLRTLISVGGWTLSGPFSAVAADAPLRAKFAKSCVAFVRKYDFDGVDIDWEYPVSGGLSTNKTQPADKQNFTLLLAALRKELDTAGKADKRRYLLTIAAPAAPATYANLELDKIAEHLDWINLMTYDFHGGWEQATGFNAPLFASPTDPTKDETVRKQFNVDAAVQAYLQAKVPPEKLNVGVPFYGRGWAGVGKDNNGLFQKAAKELPKGTWENGVYDYKDLAANYVGKFARHWDDEAKVPWLYDAEKGVMITYDDAESLKLKAEYAKKHNLGGVMCWELSGDDAKGSLLNALIEGMK
jgi:chitinase